MFSFKIDLNDEYQSLDGKLLYDLLVLLCYNKDKQWKELESVSLPMGGNDKLIEAWQLNVGEWIIQRHSVSGIFPMRRVQLEVHCMLDDKNLQLVWEPLISYLFGNMTPSRSPCVECKHLFMVHHSGIIDCDISPRLVCFDRNDY